ncbi:MAG: SLC13 family permease [Myxococcota bacterium]
MSIDAYISLGVTALVVITMALEIAAFEVIILTALTLLLVSGVLTPAQALMGFASPAVISVGALLVVAAGVRRSGVLAMAAERFLGQTHLRGALWRVTTSSCFLSAFLNNTPIVAMFLPAIHDWCKRRHLTPSRLLMPLSFATILGGTCTLVGTSTNLVLDSLMRRNGMEGLGMFEISWVGVPIALVGIITMVLLAARLLPQRRDPLESMTQERREFLVEMLVAQDSPLNGKSIATAGLRNLPGLFLTTIERHGRFLGAVSPSESLAGGDRLVFTGNVATVADLRRFPGLSVATEVHFDPVADDHALFEAVISASSSWAGMTVKDIGFRSRYEGAVIAIHRAGERLSGKIGDVILRVGDTLMVSAPDAFALRWTHGGDFALISKVHTEPTPNWHNAPAVIAIVLLMVTTVTLGWLPMVVASLSAACAMILLRLLNAQEARQALDLPMLIVIAGAMGIGHSLQVSGAATVLGGAILDIAGTAGPYGVLAATFLLGAMLTSVITNVAAVAIIFPIAVAAAENAHFDPRAYAVMAALGASASFLTPTAYQTNLMVYGPGGYRFSDFARLGFPLLGIVFLIAMLIVPNVWPFP